MTALTALVHTPAQLYAARLVLGAAEAGFFLGVIVYLSHWFMQADRAKATSNFMSAIPLSFVIGSPLAGLILGQSWFSLAGWRWLFILEGIPAIVLGTIAYFYLTDLPKEARMAHRATTRLAGIQSGRGAQDQYAGDACPAGAEIPHHPDGDRGSRFH
jgi:MFS family permease